MQVLNDGDDAADRAARDRSRPRHGGCRPLPAGRLFHRRHAGHRPRRGVAAVDAVRHLLGRRAGHGGPVTSRAQIRGSAPAAGATLRVRRDHASPLAGEIECGDTWRIADARRRLERDGGRRPGARAARPPRRRARPRKPSPTGPSTTPSSVMQSLHRGLAAPAAPRPPARVLHAAEARVDYAGVGNIHGAIVGRERSRGMVSHNGTLGRAGSAARSSSTTTGLPASSWSCIRTACLPAGILPSTPGFTLITRRSSPPCCTATMRAQARRCDRGGRAMSRVMSEDMR